MRIASFKKLSGQRLAYAYLNFGHDVLLELANGTRYRIVHLSGCCTDARRFLPADTPERNQIRPREILTGHVIKSISREFIPTPTDDIENFPAEQTREGMWSIYTIVTDQTVLKIRWLVYGGCDRDKHREVRFYRV